MGDRWRICLYAPIAAKDENRPRERSAWQAAKITVKRIRDRARWQFTSDRVFDYEAWSAFTGTNRGDMAIRLAIRDLFCQSYGEELEYIEYGWGSLTKSAVEYINANCDLFVIAGGGYLFTSESGKLGNSRIPNDLEYLRAISCHKVAYGIGLNQLLDKGDGQPARLDSHASEIVRAWLGALDLVAVRDEAAQRLLTELNVLPIYLTGDPALFLNTPRVTSFVERHVGVNFAVHGRISGSLLSKHFWKYRSALIELQRRGFVLNYFQHSDTDPVALHMFSREGIDFSVVDAAPRDMVSAYSRMQFVVCQMLHSAILATNVDVPSINIAYDRKNRNFYELFGLEKFCIHHDQFSQEWLLERVDEVCHNRAKIGATLTQKKAQFLEENVAFLERIRHRVS